MNKANQRAQIVNYCRMRGSITVREAHLYLNMNSPTKRISELKNMGYDVQTRWEERVHSDGRKVRYKRYFIKEGAN